jgi:hypothetical protein
MDNPNPVPRRQLPLVVQVPLLLLWGGICWFMVLVGLIGLSCVLLGLFSLVVDLSGVLKIRLAGQEVRAVTDKLLFTGLGAVLALVGIEFLWLARRDQAGRALLLWAQLLAVFAMLAWATGSTEILSVGG